MSWMFWLFLLVSNYLVLFSLKSMVLGLFLLINSFFMSLLMSVYSMSWYSLIFFLVYMGGLLVLFMYMSSLKFNPTFYFSGVSPSFHFLLKLNFGLLIMFSLTQITWNFKGMKWSSLEHKNFSLNLFKEKEVFFLVNMGVLLLVVLWVVTKLSFRNRGALRPMFK